MAGKISENRHFRRSHSHLKPPSPANPSSGYTPHYIKKNIGYVQLIHRFTFYADQSKTDKAMLVSNWLKEVNILK